MSRRGVWSTAWNNFLNSFRPQQRVKTFVGEDSFGNRYYEYQQPSYKSNVKRGFEAPGNLPNPPPPPPEWNLWLKNTRRFPPSDEEIRITQLNQQKVQAQLAQDAETERRAPKVGSSGRGAADVDRGTIFPSYEDIELGPGHIPDYKHQAATDLHKQAQPSHKHSSTSPTNPKSGGKSSEDASDRK